MLATRGVSAAPAVEPADRVRPLTSPLPRVLAADTILVVVLVASAFALRYPYLWDVPRFRDETFNALHALRIYRGEHLPLTDVELYIGPLFNYLVAGAMVVVGPTIYVARFVVLLFGVLTVPATYLLGREVGGRGVGLLAAALLLTNGVHIASMSHRGFSADMALFFTTVGFWLLHRAVARQDARSLALCGLFLGLGLHTHPTTVAFLPGALAWFLVRGWRWLRTPWPYAALLLFMVAYAPMIAFNVQTGGGSIRHAVYTATERPDYVPPGRSAELTAGSYLTRQVAFWTLSYLTLGGAVDDCDRDCDHLSSPALLAAAVWAGVGMLWAARRGYSLPIWLLGSCALILPVFNANHWDVIGDAHYVAKALPPIYAAMGLLAVDGARRLGASAPRRAARALLVATILAIVLAPLLPLGHYYAEASKSQPTNASLIRAMDELKAARGPDELVLLDNRLNERRVANASPWDEASTFRIFRFIMEFDAIPYEIVDVDESALDTLVARGRPVVVILSSGFTGKDTDRIGQWIERYDLRALDGRPARAPRPADRHAIFRYSPSS